MDMKWKDKVEHLSLEEQWSALYEKNINNYETGVWSNKKSTENGVPRVIENAKGIVKELPIILKKYKIKTMTDIGCSNMQWMSTISIEDTLYEGIDIVKELIELNKRMYPDYKFTQGNIVKDIPPKSDMIFLRSVLIHLPLNNCLKLIENIKKSRSKYLMVSSMNLDGINNDTSCLMLKQRDMSKDPFNFPKPMLSIIEREDVPQKDYRYMNLYKISEL